MEWNGISVLETLLKFILSFVFLKVELLMVNELQKKIIFCVKKSLKIWKRSFC